jgi:hypothetical protein
MRLACAIASSVGVTVASGEDVALGVGVWSAGVGVTLAVGCGVSAGVDVGVVTGAVGDSVALGTCVAGGVGEALGFPTVAVAAVVGVMSFSPHAANTSGNSTASHMPRRYPIVIMRAPFTRILYRDVANLHRGLVADVDSCGPLSSPPPWREVATGEGPTPCNLKAQLPPL